MRQASLVMCVILVLLFTGLGRLSGHQAYLHLVGIPGPRVLV